MLQIQKETTGAREPGRGRTLSARGRGGAFSDESGQLVLIVAPCCCSCFFLAASRPLERTEVGAGAILRAVAITRPPRPSAPCSDVAPEKHQADPAAEMRGATVEDKGLRGIGLFIDGGAQGRMELGKELLESLREGREGKEGVESLREGGINTKEAGKEELKSPRERREGGTKVRGVRAGRLGGGGVGITEGGKDGHNGGV